MPHWTKARAASNSRIRALKSDFEARIRRQLEGAGVEYAYEQRPLYFTPAPRKCRKTFDWWITTRSGKLIIVESKGWWRPKRRIAEIECIKQNPDMDIRYVFQKASTPIRKGSKTTYAKVCHKHGIPYAEGAIPQEWLDE
jgi:hypothetical protein